MINILHSAGYGLIVFIVSIFMIFGLWFYFSRKLINTYTEEQRATVGCLIIILASIIGLAITFLTL
jgi:hypothetical protein